ncbi:nitroreductase family protein [Actinomyces timonensis]|uniref:nitroreductase family protein n=1 Tax=Actinomyces timonensis TaxID=1288391 RepID=UPI00030806CD|nr:nitroreductase family protein [Actinomyces timonensis]
MSDEASPSPTAEPLSDDVRHDQYLSERYGAQPRPDDLEWTPAVETMLAHRSVRAFTPTPLTERELATVIAAAQSAPTSSNLHLWSVIVIDDDALRARIMDLADSPNQSENFAFMRQAPTVLLWVADASRNEEIMAAAGADTGTLDYLDSFLTVSVDAAMAAQNAVVAAESMGLGTCYLGSMRNLEAALCDLLGLPPHSYVVVGLALGHPAPERLGGVHPRPAQAAVVRRNLDPAPALESWLPAYEEAYGAFRASQGLDGRSWREAVLRASSRMYMDGRDEMRGAVEKQGFGLA